MHGTAPADELRDAMAKIETWGCRCIGSSVMHEFVERPKVIDIMAALEASVAAAKESRANHPANKAAARKASGKKKSVAKKSAAKKSVAKKSAAEQAPAKKRAAAKSAAKTDTTATSKKKSAAKKSA